MAKAKKTSNTAAAGIQATSTTEGTTQKRHQETYSDDLFIDTYIKARLEGSSPQTAGDYAYQISGGTGSYNAPRENPNSQIAAGLANGTMYQENGRTYYTPSAQQAYIDRVKQTQASNDWEERKNRSFGDRLLSMASGTTKDYGSGIMGYLGNRMKLLGEKADGLVDWLGEHRTPTLMGVPVSNAVREASGIDRPENKLTGENLARQGNLVEDAALQLGEDAAYEIENAKAGLSGLGRVGVDLASNLMQMGYDRVMAFLPGGPLAAMYMRSSGSGALKAKQEGATTLQQAGYSALAGGIEVLTEKMADGLAGIYGAGAADVFTERWIRKMSSSNLGRSLLRWVIGAGEEGIEEVVSDLLQPYAEMVYNGKTFSETFKQGYDPSELLYDYFIGAAVGLVGGGVGGVLGANVGPNQQAQYADQAEAELNRQGVTGRAGTRGGEIIAAQMMGEEPTRREQRILDTMPAAENIYKQMQQERENAYVNSIMEAQMQQRMAQERETAQRGETKLLSGMVQNEVQPNVRADTAGATVQTDRGPEKVEFIRDGDRNAFRLTAEDGSTRIVSGQEASAMGLNDNVMQLVGALSALGENAPAAYSVYDGSMDVDKYAAAMYQAVELYAGNGTDVRKAAQKVRESNGFSLIGQLSDVQLEMAQALGTKIYEQKQTGVQERAAKLREIRKAYQEAMSNTDATASQELQQINAAIGDARQYISDAQEAVSLTREDMTALASLGRQDSEEYRALQQAVNDYEKDIQQTKDVISEMEKTRKELQAKQPIKRKKGTVSFDGANDGKNSYEGVNPEKLNKKQKAVVDMTERLADVLDIDFSFFQGPAGMGGFYRGGNSIAVNINSGMGVGDFNHVIAAGSLSHELTHWLKQYAPEEYEALKRFILNDIAEKQGVDKLEKMIEQQQRWEKGRLLSREEATDEIVANACQTMLRDSNAITELAEQNRTLAEKIRDFIRDLIDRIKAAFEDVNINDNAPIYEAARAIQGEYEDILKLWDNALREATENSTALRATAENSSSEGNAQMQEWQGEETEAPVQQRITSANTSINANKLPVLYTDKNAIFPEGGTNIDVGGGRFDNVTEYLAGKGVRNMLFDPYNRPEETNTETLRYLMDGNRADTATCSNVLNVIAEQAARDNVILETAKAIKPEGRAYFTVYEGTGEGNSSETKSGWQENRKTATYVPEIQKYFDTVTRKGKLIIAENPKADLPKAAWETTPGKATRFQQWDKDHNDWAPEFYSKMNNVVQEWTNGKGQRMPDKMATSQVVGWLKGKGVRDEEIKWSGIVPYLEGKKTVTQQEIQTVMAGNETRIETKVLEAQRPKYYAEDPDSGEQIEFENFDKADIYARKLAFEKGYSAGSVKYEDGWFTAIDNGKEVDLLELNDVDPYDYRDYEEYSGENATKWGEYTLPGGGNYREILFKLPGSTYENDASLTHWGVDAPGTIAHARVQDMQDKDGRSVLFVEEIQSDLHNKGAKYGYANKETEQLAEIMDKMETNQATDEDYAYFDRMRDKYIPSMREYEKLSGEIRSSRIRADRIAAEMMNPKNQEANEKFFRGLLNPNRPNRAQAFVMGNFYGHIPLDDLVDAGMISDEDAEFILKYREDEKRLKEVQEAKDEEESSIMKGVPDVPFAGSANTYHEYVMKHLLRLAAEGDYDAIGWTTAQQQVDRWRVKYEELYKIEYDQNIPKFMRRYGKQWGATVSGLGLTNGYDVWGMLLTNEMKDSVLHEGQPMFQRWDENQISLDEWMNGGQAARKGMSPEVSARLDAAAALEQQVKDYFTGVQDDSEYYMSPDEIEEATEIDPYTNQMYDAEGIIMKLSGTSEGLKGKAKTQVYELMDSLLDYVPTGTPQQNWISERWSRNKDFTKWYDRKHPSLYYKGYQPGKLDKPKEKRHLQDLIENENTPEDLRKEAQIMLDAMRSGANTTWYQKWDDSDGDTKNEREGRTVAYTRIQGENRTLKDTIDGLNAAIGKQNTTIEKLQNSLKLGKGQQVRESEAQTMANSLLKRFNSTVDKNTVAQEIKAMGDYILQNKKLDENELKQQARAIAASVLNESTEEVDADEDVPAIRDLLGKIPKKLSISDLNLGELDKVDGYNEFRKRNIGNFILTKRVNDKNVPGYKSLDSVYSDLQPSNRAYLPDVTNEGEMAIVLSELFERAKPKIINPHEQYMGEAIEELSNQITQEMIGGIFKPTTGEAEAKRLAKELDRAIAAGTEKADALAKAAKELAGALESSEGSVRAMNNYIKRLRDTQDEAANKELDMLRETIYDLTIALDKAGSRYKTLKVSADMRMAQIRAEGRAREEEKLAKQKAKENAHIASVRDHYKDMAERAKERRKEAEGVTKYRKQVIEKSKKLSDWLLKNSDKEHVPEVLKRPLLELLTSIDYTSKRALAGGEETQADRKFGARLQRLEQLLSQQQSYINGDGDVDADLGGYIDIGPDMLSFLRDMAQNVTNAMNTGTDYTINQMDAQQLKDLSNLLSTLSAGIRNMNRLMANARYTTVRDAASQDITYMESLGKAPESAGNKLSKFLQWQDAVPYYAMKRFGKGGQTIFDGLTRGWETLARNAKEIIDFTEKAYTDKEVNDWKAEIHNVTLEDGSKIRMTTAQIMELSMLLRRDQARKHLFAGGLRIGNIETGKGMKHRTIADTDHYHITTKDISTLLGELTPRQMDVANALQQYMADRGAEWGNEISMKRFGYNFYTEGENYYPIVTDANDRPMRDTDAIENSMFRLLNLSSSKSLNPKASNALVVNDIFDTFADHMADQAKLNALGLPILDAIKWFNYKERIDNDDGTYNTRTLQAAMEKAYQSEAQRYFRTLMKDINGVHEGGDRSTGVVSKLTSNFKVASVGANLRVALLQPTAYVRALTLISPRNLVRAFAYKGGYEEAMQWSGTALWKAMGYFDTNISRNMRDQIKHNDTAKGKIQEASMALAEKGDSMTWGRLWTACKLQTQQLHPELTGDKLMMATADLFRGVIYSSQVMDSTLTRSEIMRSSTAYDKLATAFMAEPTLSYNVLLDAYSEYQRDVRRNGKQGAWKRNQDKLKLGFTVYVSSAVVSAIAESLWDAVRDDDDYESFLSKFLSAFFGEETGLKALFAGNLQQDLNPLAKIPYAKDIISLLSGYTSGNMATDAVANLIKAFEIWKETIELERGILDKPTKTTYYGNMQPWGKIYKTLQALSQLSGLPASAAARDVVAIWNTTVGNIVPYWKVRTYDAGPKSNIKSAYAEGRMTFNEAVDQMLANGVFTSREDAEKELTKKGSSLSPDMDNLLDSIRRGNNESAQKIRQNMVEHGTPVSYIWNNVQTDVKEQYLAGNISYESAQAALTNYGGVSAAEAGYQLKWWQFEEAGKAQADSNGNGDLSQKELGAYLLQETRAGRMTETEADALWRGRNVGETAPWKTSWSEWKAKQK